MSESFLEIKHINKSFGSQPVLKDINLSIKEKEIVVLLGPSGCGKTTLLRIISGLLDADSGSIELEGTNLLTVPVEKRQIGFVFQKYALFPHMNVEDNICFGLKLRKVPKDEIKKRLDAVLDLVELKGLEKRRIHELSGGQQQRVALARAVIIKPKLMLLDEPLSNLDAKLRANVRVNIVRILRKLGITAIMVTHDQIEAMTMGDRIVLLSDGVVQQEADSKDIYNNPANIFVAEFLGSPRINFIPVEVLGDKCILGGKEFNVNELYSHIITKTKRTIENGRYTLGVRPESILITEDGMDGDVIMCEMAGADTNVHILLFGKEFVIRVNSADCTYSDGDHIHVHFAPSSCFLFDQHGDRIE